MWPLREVTAAAVASILEVGSRGAGRGPLQQVQVRSVRARRPRAGSLPGHPGGGSPSAQRPACAAPAAASEGWGEGGEPSCVLPRPLLKCQRPPFAAPRVRPSQSPAPQTGRPREQSRGCREGGGGAGRERAVSARQSPVARRAGALAAPPPVRAPGGCAPPSPGAPRARPKRPEGGAGSSGRARLRQRRQHRRSRRARLPRPGLPERSARAPGVPRAGGHPIRPLAAPGTRRAPPLPPPQNELSTAALGAAPGPARICPAAANPEAGGPWRNGGTMEGGIYEVWGVSPGSTSSLSRVGFSTSTMTDTQGPHPLLVLPPLTQSLRK